jgi:hypothetical protein
MLIPRVILIRRMSIYVTVEELHFLSTLDRSVEASRWRLHMPIHLNLVSLPCAFQNEILNRCFRSPVTTLQHDIHCVPHNFYCCPTAWNSIEPPLDLIWNSNLNWNNPSQACMLALALGLTSSIDFQGASRIYICLNS